MRKLALLGILSLGLAAPAQADPISAFTITLEFQGVMTTGGPPVVAPFLSAGDPFSIVMSFRSDPSSNSSEYSKVFFTLGAYSGETICAVCRFPSFVNFFSPVTLYTNPGGGTGPPHFAYWEPAGFGTTMNTFVQNLFEVNLNQGWQSGTFSMNMENIFTGGRVSGNITSVRQVPEPATILLTLVGVGFGARRLRKRHVAHSTSRL